ncbi:hypothetical protein ACM66B_003852 [Microbotryomycetes sp. NB124-2]
MAGNLSHSMRANYNQHGVGGYYSIVSETYRNPHYPGLKKVLTTFMDRYMEHEKSTSVSVLDLAAGSGEATEILLNWKKTRWPKPQPPPAAPAVSSSPVVQEARPVSTPPRPFIPRPAVARPIKPTLTTPEPELNIVAADPYTAPAYQQRTGLECLPLSFADVAAGKLPTPQGIPFEDSAEDANHSGEGSTRGDNVFDLVVVSFALHLIESSSELWALLTMLASRARWLVVVAPHKKPDVKDSWGWTRWDPSDRWKAAEGRGNVGGQEGDGFEIVLDRVRLRVWRSEQQLWQ